MSETQKSGWAAHSRESVKTKIYKCQIFFLEPRPPNKKSNLFFCTTGHGLFFATCFINKNRLLLKFSGLVSTLISCGIIRDHAHYSLNTIGLQDLPVGPWGRVNKSITVFKLNYLRSKIFIFTPYVWIPFYVNHVMLFPLIIWLLYVFHI